MEWNALLNATRFRITTLPTDHRQEFERDYDRVVFSTPLKRLQDKAQVFPLEQHDAIRTRLTHSLEVSAVARGLAISASKWMLDQQLIMPGMDRSIEAIAATCGLIHDLGNPPFGHAGEYAIQSWFEKTITENELKRRLGGNDQQIQDFLRFEGNAQTIRLVSKLQILVDFHGLNLTFGTLSALLKYVSPSHKIVKDGDSTRKKPGFFASENDLVTLIQEKCQSGQFRNPITFFVEAADDIVYSVADIEDGIKKGIISWNEVDDILKQKAFVQDYQDITESKDKILKAGRENVPSNLANDVHGAAFRVAAIRFLVAQAFEAFKAKYADIMKGSYLGELVTEGRTVKDGKSPLITVLKETGLTRIYCTPSTLKLELMGRKIISDLLTIFWEGAEILDKSGKTKTKSFPGKIGALLSENYKQVFANSLKVQPELPEAYHRFQLVTDYICGMTDSFALALYRRLTGIELPS